MLMKLRVCVGPLLLSFLSVCVGCRQENVELKQQLQLEDVYWHAQDFLKSEGRYPISIEELKNFNSDIECTDAWGNNVQLKIIDSNLVVSSPGSDGLHGTADDLMFSRNKDGPIRKNEYILSHQNGPV